MARCLIISHWRIMFKEQDKQLTAEQAKEKALRLLEFRSHSQQELLQKLRRAGAQKEDIESILAFCREYHLVDDRDYAKRLARDLCNLKKYGKRRIRSELYNRGISAEDVEEALAEIEDSEDVLLELVCKRLRGNFEQKNKDKIIRYFTYRGYDVYQIKTCIEQLEGEEDGI